ncbi:PAS domain-containing protein [Daejeonella sp.]|uniref:PAS domain-containing protein n=1 Tax=Daejeonella sp. TaxID=2805397 RepID=UPI0039835F70
MNFTSLKAIFDASPSPLLILLPDFPRFTIVCANKVYCKLTNTPASQLINKELFEAFPENPNDPEANGKENLTSSLNQVIATKNAHRMETQKYDVPVPGTQHFEERYWSLENIPVLNDNGEIVYIMHSLSDVTEKKGLEQAFDVERQRFHDLYSQAPSCMGILKGPDHVYELANPLYLKLIDKKDIIGKTVKEVLPELEAQGIFKFLDNVYQTGNTFSATEMLVQFDFDGNGKLVDTYLNFIYQAHRNNEGQIDGILFFAIDVTEQILSRKKIQSSENRFKTLIQEGSDLISIIDEDLNYIYLSPAYTKVLGIKHEDLISTALIDRIHKDDLEIVNQTSERLANEKRVQFLPFRYKVDEDEYRWLETIATNLLDDPTIKGILFNSNDITERMNYIQEVEEQNKNLKEIAWIQSHLVRTPVVRILGLIDLINNHKDNIDLAEMLSYIYDSTQDLDRIIKEIVDKTQKIDL